MPRDPHEEPLLTIGQEEVREQVSGDRAAHAAAGRIPRPAASGVALRDVSEPDLPIFFEHQLDPEANDMAGFPARDRGAFTEHWARVLADQCAIKKTILFDGHVAGNIGSWEQEGERNVGYWIGREYWGKGIATRALSEFLDHERVRPLYAHVVRHNIGSIRVLEKCGFARVGEEGEEVILQLNAGAGDE